MHLMSLFPESGASNYPREAALVVGTNITYFPFSLCYFSDKKLDYLKVLNKSNNHTANVTL